MPLSASLSCLLLGAAGKNGNYGEAFSVPGRQAAHLVLCALHASAAVAEAHRRILPQGIKGTQCVPYS